MTRINCSLALGGIEECFEVEKELLDDHENELKDLLASLKIP
jgi:hypothetical protein